MYVSHNLQVRVYREKPAIDLRIFLSPSFASSAEERAEQEHEQDKEEEGVRFRTRTKRERRGILARLSV